MVKAEDVVEGEEEGVHVEVSQEEVEGEVLQQQQQHTDQHSLEEEVWEEEEVLGLLEVLKEEVEHEVEVLHSETTASKQPELSKPQHDKMALSHFRVEQPWIKRTTVHQLSCLELLEVLELLEHLLVCGNTTNFLDTVKRELNNEISFLV